MGMIGKRSLRADKFTGLGMLLTMVVLVVTASTGAAQTAGVSSQPVLLGAAGSTRFDIPAQPMVDALTQFGLQSGLQVSVDAGLIRGLQSPGVSGDLEPERALRQLLSGTGITYRLEGGNTVMIELASVDNGPLTLAPIRVQGELLERNLQDVQTSVVVLAGEDLERSPDPDIKRLLDKVPGIKNQGDDNGFVIRGIGTQSFGGDSTAISIQVDGVSIHDQRAIRNGPSSLWDLEQMVVFLGPQSTQQGQNAIAGAIVFRSKDPAFEDEYKFRIDYGSNNEHRIAGVANMPLGKYWAVRIAYDEYSTDGDIDNQVTGGDADDGGHKTYRAKLRYANQDSFDAVLTFSHVDNDDQVNRVADGTFPDSRVAFNTEDIQETTTTFGSLLLKYDLNADWQLHSETGFVKTKWDNTVTGFPDLYRDAHNFQQEIKATYQGDRVRLVGGLYYTDYGHEAEGGPFPFEESSTENLALFGELEFDFSDRWTGVAGVRADRYENTLESRVDKDSEKYDEFLPKLGLVYNFSDDVSLGFTYQRGYRQGGNTVDFSSALVESYDSEFTDNYELSFRSLWLDQRLRLNANLFYTEYEDIQLFGFNIISFDPLAFETFIINAGTAESYGGEIQLDYEFAENLFAFVNAAYLETEILEDLSGNQGNEFPGAPKWSGSAGFQYFVNEQLEFSVTGVFTDSFFEQVTNAEGGRTNGFLTVDAQARYALNDSWSVSVFARNVFDRQYVINQRVNPNLSAAGEERVLGFSLNAVF